MFHGRAGEAPKIGTQGLFGAGYDHCNHTLTIVCSRSRRAIIIWACECEQDDEAALLAELARIKAERAEEATKVAAAAAQAAAEDVRQEVIRGNPLVTAWLSNSCPAVSWLGHYTNGIQRPVAGQLLTGDCDASMLTFPTAPADQSTFVQRLAHIRLPECVLKKDRNASASFADMFTISTQDVSRAAHSQLSRRVHGDECDAQSMVHGVDGMCTLVRDNWRPLPNTRREPGKDTVSSAKPTE